METQKQSVPQTSKSAEPKLGLRSLPEILYGLAEVYKFNMTERALEAYMVTVGHRTDEDLNKAYKEILRQARYMPTPAELLEQCGPLKLRRDGTRPE